MYAIVEMKANPTDLKEYGEFVKFRSLVDDTFAAAYQAVLEMLNVAYPCMARPVHCSGAPSTGMAGMATILMAQDEMALHKEVQLFASFEDTKRLWIFEVCPEKWSALRP